MAKVIMLCNQEEECLMTWKAGHDEKLKKEFLKTAYGVN